MGMRTPITYYGGKQLLCKEILNLMPSHRVYVEPFFGGGAVFFAKPKGYLEVINDTNDNLITFYRVCQNETLFEKLMQRVQTTLHSESDYIRAGRIWRNPMRENASDLDIAWAAWLQTNMSFAASPSGGWKWDNGTAGSHTGIVMDGYRENFSHAIHERLKHVQISCRDALTVIEQRDSKDTFYYLDPPYINADQKHYRGYTQEDFERLLRLLENLKGGSKFLLSNYASPMLSEYVERNGWRVKIVEMAMKCANFHGTGGRTKKEVLVYNYELEPDLFRPAHPYDGNEKKGEHGKLKE